MLRFLRCGRLLSVCTEVPREPLHLSALWGPRAPFACTRHRSSCAVTDTPHRDAPPSQTVPSQPQRRKARLTGESGGGRRLRAALPDAQAASARSAAQKGRNGKKPPPKKRSRTRGRTEQGSVDRAPCGGDAEHRLPDGAGGHQHTADNATPTPSFSSVPASLTAASLFYRSGVVTDVDRTTASLASLAVSPLRVGGSPAEHYRARVKEFVVNPFNGRDISVHSLVMRQLESLGFLRDRVNQLQLTWSPERYFQRFHSTLRAMQQQRRRLPASLQQERPAARDGRGRGRDGMRSGASGVREWEGEGEGEEEGSVTTEEVLRRLLKPFCGPRAPLWRSHVAELMRRPDALTAVPATLRSRYDSLTNAYMPPKLDAMPDPAIRDIVLTQDQENVAQLALRGYSLYVGGSAGTGKTVLIKVAYRKLSQLGLRVAMTATTGVAAVQLGGCTFHRAFNVPVEENALAAVRKSWDYNALRAVDVLIVDEVSLLSAQMLDALDMEARLARMHYAPFGGIQVILCGDFLQLASEATIDVLPAYQSETFKHLLKLKLVTPMRHADGDPLIKLLRDLRRGRCDAQAMSALDRPVPPDAAEVTFIFPRRRDAQQLNDEKLSELQTAEMTCTTQRGPLELVGTFTRVAMVAFDTDKALLSLPSRDTIAAVVKEEVHAFLNECSKRSDEPRETGGRQAASAARSAQVCFKELAEHDIVVMPTRTASPGVTLRLRVHVDPMEAAAAREAARQARRCTHTLRKSTTAATTETDPDPFTGGSHGGAWATSSPAEDSDSLAMPPKLPVLRRSPAAYMLHHPNAWAEVVSRVARRLHGSVVNLFDEEPMELVPLSVSTALADAASGDVADTLQPLRLKLGARVMVNRNLSRTVSNGSVGIVETFAPPDVKLFPHQMDMSTKTYYQRALGHRLFPQLPVVRLLSGEVVQIPPLPTMLGGTVLTYYYGHEVYTLPLQLGYGFTVHKVQGLTLSGLVVLDCRHFFECPHLIYVACSRVRSLEQLIVRNLKPEMVIVKKSALDFSDSLQEAKAALVLAVPPDTPRAAWTSNFMPPVYSL